MRIQARPGGILPVDKPSGPTSHDIVSRARRALGTRKIGHAGTLDPFASGLLLLCVEGYTRLSQYLSRLDKRYEATARLGVRTDTHDREGSVVEATAEWLPPSIPRIEEALSAFEGVLDQIPPQHSAKKVGGEAMYARARRGEWVDLEPVRVQIHRIELTDVALPEIRFRLRCSSGTYIRALARDLGEELGVGAHLTALRRTHIGTIGLDSAIAAEALDDRDEALRRTLTPLAAMGSFPRIDIGEENAVRLAQGRGLQDLPRLPEGEESLLVSCGDTLVAVASVRGSGVRPEKVFAELLETEP